MTPSDDTAPAAWHDVGEPDDFPDNAVWPVIAAGVPVAMFRLGDALYALRDQCTHGAARLSDGYVEDGCIECPLHQGTFDIRTGAPCKAPVTVAVRAFPGAGGGRAGRGGGADWLIRRLS